MMNLMFRGSEISDYIHGKPSPRYEAAVKRLKEDNRVRIADLLYQSSQIDNWEAKMLLLNQILENSTDVTANTPEEECSTARIKRQLQINGVSRWVTGATEQEYANNLIKAVSMETQAPASANVSEKHDACAYAWNYYTVFMKPGIENVTQETYERQLRVHICPVLEGKFIEDLTSADVMCIFNGMDTPERKASKSSKEKVKTVLNQILEAAVEDGLLKKNLLKCRGVKLTGEPSKSTEAYTVEQMTYLACSLGRIKKPYDRNYLAIQALHPLRPEEVLGLRWQDIDLENNLIHVRNTVTHPKRNRPEFKSKTKTDQSRRTLALVPEIKEHLTVGADEDFVVGGEKCISYQQLTRMCERIKSDTGFSEKITPQRFRTTVLTDIYEQSKDVKEVQHAAGHTTVSMTMKYYVKGRAASDGTATAISNAYGLT